MLCGLSKTPVSAPPAVTPKSAFAIVRHPLVNFELREIGFLGALKSHELYDGPFPSGLSKAHALPSQLPPPQLSSGCWAVVGSVSEQAGGRDDFEPSRFQVEQR